MILVFSLCANAHQKSDVIILVNGDQLTGEIKSMEYGILKLSTEYLGSVLIEWKNIDRAYSNYEYEVRDSSGNLIYGQLSQSSSAGELAINTNGSVRQIAILDIAELRPVGGTFKDHLDAKISSGFSYSRASEVLQFSLQPELEYQGKKALTRFSGRTTITDTKEDRTQSNLYSLQREYWTKRPNVVRWYAGSYEDNDAQALDYRVTGGGGFARAFVDNSSSSLRGLVGLQLAKEQDQDRRRTNSVEAVIGARFLTWQFQSPELSLDSDLILYPSLTESGRMRANGDISLNWEIIHDLYWNLSAWWSYDNESTEDTSDYGVTTGLGWKY
jgi:Protein of unknown function, DUF481